MFGFETLLSAICTLRYCTVKIPWIFTAVPYTFVSVNRNAIAMWARASLFHQFTDTNLYKTSSVKIWKTHHKICVDIGIFLQCSRSIREQCIIMYTSDSADGSSVVSSLSSSSSF